MSEIQNGDQADLKNKILKQVEFYFGDSNLPYDKFLYTLTTTNKDRWVPINTIASFKKMKLISEDIDLITEAVKESPELLEVSEDGLNVRRKTELVRPEALFERTIYAKGFPTEIDGDNKAFFELQEEIEKMFSEFGKVEAVRMRKTDTKPSKFKGSVFVEYAVLDDAKKAAEQYKDEPNSTRKPKKFNAFAANFSQPTKTKSSYAQDSVPEGMLLKFSLEKEDTSVEDIKVNWRFV
ncbi:hypothetical protein K450DRAFT_242763 [Umbelopsis ramanniana AG]|uniref:Uncharacterized protein n=1 Tax=Umbelopsis ramanniana AG TaxID=1314678 RepID=A0AAD5E9I6_UMBRA|nr:uncharacterized protein K450DRAFT_242763 [Umbelopsis ramanniana AG]KAI8579337.1 hypothetical protein K450DRAFT_242763 [Umbelopsis ramanniana AG]